MQLINGTGVLLVADDQDRRRSMRALLEHAGYVVREVSDNTEAIGLVHSSAQPMIVVLSASHIHLLGAVEWDRRMSRHHAYVLVSSHAGFRPTLDEALVAQVSMSVLYEPFDEATLLDTVRRAERWLPATPIYKDYPERHSRG